MGEPRQYKAFLVDVVIGLRYVINPLRREFVLLGGSETIDGKTEIPTVQSVIDSASELNILIVRISGRIDGAQLDFAVQRAFFVFFRGEQGRAEQNHEEERGNRGRIRQVVAP